MDYDQKLPPWSQELQDKWLATLPLFVSIPRSGCNWLQAVMELYFDRHRAGKGPQNPSWLETKFVNPMWMHTHDNFANSGEGEIQTDKPAIFLWRSPVDVIYSLLKLHDPKIADFLLKLPMTPPLGTLPIIDEKCHSFANLYKKWSSKPNVLVVKYEHVLEHPLREMKRISEHHDMQFDEEKAKWAFELVGNKKKTNKKNGEAPHFKNKESGTESYETSRNVFRQKLNDYIMTTISKKLGE